MCLLNGTGIDEDETEAQMWLQRAASHGSEDAKELLMEYFFEDYDFEQDENDDEEEEF